MIIQRFDSQYQPNCITIKVRSFRLANLRVLYITQEATSFLVRLRNLHTSFS